ncbi:MAG: hypothetical protein K2M47_05825 [Clostridiales bacterium]|nr:hypothetical protein [Clostridiales bacterium]
MARETKTVQCYPDDNKINAMIERYGAFGWELINNQRCQEYEGTYDGYRHWSTFNKLTFSRDKSASWYSDVTSLERAHDKLMDEEPVLYAKRPSKGWLFYGIIGLIFGVMIWLALGGMLGSFFEIFTLVPALVLIGIGVILLVVYIRKIKNYNTAYDAYYTLKKAWESTSEKDAKELRVKAAKLVDGGYVEDNSRRNTSSNNDYGLSEIFCTQCGTKNDSSEIFCTGCGRKLRK